MEIVSALVLTRDQVFFFLNMAKCARRVECTMVDFPLVQCLRLAPRHRLIAMEGMETLSGQCCSIPFTYNGAR